MKTFYINWAKNGLVPTYQHENFYDAQVEARRLSEKLNCEVFTLQCVQSIKPAEKFTITKFESDDLPF